MSEAISKQDYDLLVKVAGYQAVLEAVVKNHGIEALEEIVDEFRMYSPHDYVIFLQNQIPAREMEKVPSWSILKKEDGTYGLTKDLTKE